MFDAMHPLYIDRLPDWEQMDDVCAGQRVVKAKAEKYLPPTSGMIANGWGKGATTIGQQAYDAYRLRALFHGFTREAINGLLGVIHRKPPVIEVPDALKPMVEKATVAGESLEMLWQRITEGQLRDGRLGLVTDIPTGAPVGAAEPYIALYVATAIPNWNAGPASRRQVLKMVTLNESGWQNVDGLRWELVVQYRILTTGATARQMGVEGLDAADDDYVVGVVSSRGGGSETTLDLATAEWIVPSLASSTLKEVPFTFVNVNDTVSDPDSPPLLPLADLDLAIYRAEADYRQALHMQAQASLLVKGATEAQQVHVGAGAVTFLGTDGDMEYVEIAGAGLAEVRTGLENDKGQASRFAVQLLDTTGEAESGEALRVRVSARTASIARMQNTAAAAIRERLVTAGRWKGLSEAVLETIVVTPNLDFSDATTDTNEISFVMDAKVKGAPLSKKSIHAWMRDREFTEMTYEEELEAIAEETTDSGGDGGTPVNVDPNAPPAPPVVPPKGKQAA